LRLIPFLAYPEEIRRVIYTTNAVESVDMSLRKIIKNRGSFPTDEAALKLDDADHGLARGSQSLRDYF
jgi:putative transposase